MEKLMGKGTVIVIEGTDGSGKQTQSEKLYKALLEMGLKVRKVQYPDYDSESSALVKMYLRGDFGMDPESVSSICGILIFCSGQIRILQHELERLL